jgi:hypothetical protein
LAKQTAGPQGSAVLRFLSFHSPEQNSRRQNVQMKRPGVAEFQLNVEFRIA